MQLSKHFNREEFACQCGCGFATVDVKLLELLETIRTHFDSTVKINSACRCSEHNSAIGGSYGSKHKQGIASDIVVSGVNPMEVYRFANDHMPNTGGIGMYKTFTHVDVRENKARWNG
jgi:uncharacterized protein YcbK (DUF882 family)